jgi:hypothetical protein
MNGYLLYYPEPLPAKYRVRISCTNRHVIVSHLAPRPGVIFIARYYLNSSSHPSFAALP